MRRKCKTLEEPSIAQRYTTTTIKLDAILIILVTLKDNARSIPFVGMWALFGFEQILDLQWTVGVVDDSYHVFLMSEQT